VNAINEGAGTGPRERERPPGIPGAAVHRHILYRINAINDSLKKKKNIDRVMTLWKTGYRIFKFNVVDLPITSQISAPRRNLSSSS